MVGCDWIGSEKPKRSLEVLLAVGFVAGAVVDAKLKSPSPLDALGGFSGWLIWVGGLDAVAVFNACFGRVSKKPPLFNDGGDVTAGEVKLVR